ncbi:MAG: hypothetical protein AT710_04215 [Thermocladium sp. ECH_B]|nr:MAG: hypothetical protein AT710_04215 [Thermocladium sp. ECH_B]
MVVRIPSSLCAACKGRRSLCGLPKCPLLERQKAMKPTLDIRGNVFGASPPSVVVGESGYPNIHVLIGGSARQGWEREPHLRGPN